MRERRRVWPLFVPDAPRHPADCLVWQPLVDIYRTRYGWMLKFDLAGVRLEDVTVSIRGRFVSVSGLRKNMFVEERATYYSMEISYNRFERTIEMPTQLDHARMTLEARDGFLLVRLAEEAKDVEGKYNAR